MKILYFAGFFLILILMGASRLLGENTQIVFYVIIFVMSLGLAFYVHWFKKFSQKVNSLLPLIEKEPDTYIVETEKILEGKLPNNVRTMLIMNIAIAYMEKDDFTTAKQKLTSINVGALKKANGAIYFLNLAYTLIHLGENEQALDIIKKYKRHLLRLPTGGNLPRLIAFVQIFEAMQDGKWDDAAEQMRIAKENWPNAVTGVNFTFLEKQLKEHRRSAKEIQA